MQKTRAVRWVATAAILVATTGCGGKPELVPVTGTVKIDGKAVDGVRVYFWPKDQSAKTFVNQFAIGFSDKEGRFSLTGTNGQGVEAGEYKVTFARTMTAAGPAAAKPNVKGEKHGNHEALPPDLTEYARTKYTATVSAANKDFVFDLSTK